MQADPPPAIKQFPRSGKNRNRKRRSRESLRSRAYVYERNDEPA